MALEPLVDLKVVDLFAGSGALGIEALSRGAAYVDFVESERSAREDLAGFPDHHRKSRYRLSARVACGSLG